MDATTGHEVLNFMGTYSGYNQIKMHPPDKDKTAYITNRGIYYYKIMSFVLKNAGTTFQKMVNKAFEEQIGRTMKVYVDGMLVKSLQSVNHLQHLTEVFNCSDGIRYNSTLRNVLQSCLRQVPGISDHSTGHRSQPRPDIRLLSVNSPTCVKKVQMLNGRLAALNWILSQSTDKCKPFFQTIKKNGADFCWNVECEAVF